MSTGMAANLIVNGDFENPVFALAGAFQSFPAIPGCDPYEDAVAVYLSKTGHVVENWPTVGAEGSSQFADMGNAPDTRIQQTFNLSELLLTPTLSWYDATYTVTLRDADGVVARQDFGTVSKV